MQALLIALFFGAWSMGHGAWGMEYGALSKVQGVWSMEYGIKAIGK